MVLGCYNSAFFNCIGYVVSNSKMIVNEELERMWKEVVMAYFRMLSQHLP
jgi:hypothetical protein